MATNRPNCIASSGVIHCGISDHDVVYAVRTLRNSGSKDISKRVTVHKLKNFDLPAFWSVLSKINFNHIETLISDPNET